MSNFPGSDSVYKEQANRLRAFLANNGVELKHTHALEAVAQMHGYPNWHLLQAGADHDAVKDESTFTLPPPFTTPSQQEIEDLIKHLNDDVQGTPIRCIAVAVTTNTHFWALWDNEETHQREITLEIETGKQISEGAGPFACDCPVEWLERTPVQNQSWRKRVLKHAALETISQQYLTVPPLPPPSPPSPLVYLSRYHMTGASVVTHTLDHVVQSIVDYIGYLTEAYGSEVDYEIDDEEERDKNGSEVRHILKGSPEKDFALCLRSFAEALEKMAESSRWANRAVPSGQRQGEHNG